MFLKNKLSYFGFGLKKTKIAVHGGNFHPDDVFSVALLSIIFDDNIEIIRSRSHEIYSKADFVVDVGLEYDPEKNRFDHHQEGGAGERSNGIKYSSIGLLWKKYGTQICGSEKVAKIIEERIIQQIDADDCGMDLSITKIEGVRPLPFIDRIYDVTPTWKEQNISFDEAFLTAVSHAEDFLKREIKVEKDEEEAEEIIDKIYEESPDKKIIVIENPLLPKSILIKYPEPTFIVKPDKEGSNWRINTLNKEKHGFEVRKNFPESWWGKNGEELSKISGVEDAVFCRIGGIYAGAKSKEGAIALAKLAIESKVEGL